MRPESQNVWTKSLVKHTTYKEEELISMSNQTQRAILKISVSTLKTMYDHYNDDKYYKVPLIFSQKHG